jgi:hypothetical protein
MTDRVLEQMTVGVATRKYRRSLEPVPPELEEHGTSKTAVSRRFVEVLSNLVTRGLDPSVTRPFVIDGSTALRAAVRDVFGKRALGQRCQVHEMRKVESHLPKSEQKAVKAARRALYKSTKVETAKRLLHNLARTLEREHPSAAALIREGLDETLTVMALGLPRTLERSFSPTNPIENLNEPVGARRSEEGEPDAGVASGRLDERHPRTKSACFSASSAIASAMRSLIEPPGFRCSHFTSTGIERPRAIRPSGTRGVRPMCCRMLRRSIIAPCLYSFRYSQDFSNSTLPACQRQLGG